MEAAYSLWRHMMFQWSAAALADLVRRIGERERELREQRVSAND
jgi:hypothetical protein